MAHWYPIKNAVNPDLERAYVGAGSEPIWARVFHRGVDETDRPETWNAEDRLRRVEWEARRTGYLRDLAERSLSDQ